MMQIKVAYHSVMTNRHIFCPYFFVGTGLWNGVVGSISLSLSVLWRLCSSGCKLVCRQAWPCCSVCHQTFNGIICQLSLINNDPYSERDYLDKIEERMSLSLLVLVFTRHSNTVLITSKLRSLYSRLILKVLTLRSLCLRWGWHQFQGCLQLGRRAPQGKWLKMGFRPWVLLNFLLI